MRVVLVMSSKTWGGIEQVSVDYARLLRDRGHDVIMCLHPKSEVPAVGRDLESVRVVLDRIARGGMGHINPLKLVRCQQFVGAHRPDVIVIMTQKVLRLFVAVTRSHCPVVAWCGTARLDRAHSADAIIGITPRAVECLRRIQDDRRLPHRPIHYIPNPLSISVSTREPVARDPNRLPTIGALARMTDKKGFHVLLRAVGQLRESGVSFRLVLGGDGPERQALVQLSRQLGLADHVDFPGWVTDREEFFDGIDLFCLPSTDEPFGLVVTEAMARGCPVVVSDTEGPLTIVDDGVTGLVVKKGESDVCAKALRQLIENPRLAARLAMAARDVVQRRFGSKVIGEQLDTVLASITANYRAGRVDASSGVTSGDASPPV